MVLLITPRCRKILLRTLITFFVIALVVASLLTYDFIRFARTEWIQNEMKEDDLKLQAKIKIPSIIHQTYKNIRIPEKWSNYQSSCNNTDVSLKYNLWTDEDNLQFITKYYPSFLATYNSYTYTIQRADAIRYFLLYHFGGIYVDLDISCARDIDRIRNVPAWIPKTEPIGFSNDAMGSIPKHPFFRQVIEALPYWNINLITSYPTVMISTGPLFLSIQAYIYDRNQKNNDNSKLMVLPIPVIF